VERPDDTAFVHAWEEPDTVVLRSLASIIMAADAVDMNEISEAFEEMSSSATRTTLTHCSCNDH
jgi:hypothetical protein